MIGYFPGNLTLIEDEAHWKVRVLAVIGWLLNIQFHVEGIPFGGNFKGRHRLETADGGSQI